MCSASSQTASGGLGFPTDSAIVLYLWLQYQLIHCYAQEYPNRKTEIKFTIEFFSHGYIMDSFIYSRECVQHSTHPSNRDVITLFCGYSLVGLKVLNFSCICSEIMAIRVLDWTFILCLLRLRSNLNLIFVSQQSDFLLIMKIWY